MPLDKAPLIAAPLIKPLNPNFSSGPCTKRPGWKLDALSDAALGRSHRAAVGKSKLQSVIEKSKALLGLPEDWVLGIVPASDTGAVEIALWSLLGPRGVDVLSWESFGSDWAVDIEQQLKLKQVNHISADYGHLPDLSAVNPANDLVFTWNGTTSGVRVPDASWISADREGLAICDATSAAFAMPMDFGKLDVVTWSWQKVLGGEAAHGMLALSPRAVERLENFEPNRPLPKLFRLTKKGKLNRGIFEGATINTPSMLAVEDALDALNWAEEIGGGEELIARCDRNFKAVADFVEANDNFEFLAFDPATRSTTSVCLKIANKDFLAMDDEAQTKALNSMSRFLETEGVAFDIKAYRTAPKGFRIWCGATVEVSDVAALMPWLDYALQNSI